jgi:hypothetical protein
MVPVTSCFYYLLVNGFYFLDNLNRFDMFPRIRARMKARTATGAGQGGRCGSWQRGSRLELVAGARPEYLI